MYGLNDYGYQDGLGGIFDTLKGLWSTGKAVEQVAVQPTLRTIQEEGLTAGARKIAGYRAAAQTPTQVLEQVYPETWPRHTVKAGETLSAIGARYGVDWRAIAAAYAIKPPYTIYPGQRIAVQPPAGVKVQPPMPAPGAPIARTRKPGTGPISQFPIVGAPGPAPAPVAQAGMNEWIKPIAIGVIGGLILKALVKKKK